MAGAKGRVMTPWPGPSGVRPPVPVRSSSPRWTATEPGWVSTSTSPGPWWRPSACPSSPPAGWGRLAHLVDGAVSGGADAVLAASIFHRRQHSIAEAKAYLAAHGVCVRPAQAD